MLDLEMRQWIKNREILELKQYNIYVKKNENELKLRTES